MNEETHRLRFRQDRRKGDESHREWADRLRDHFEKWTKEGDIPLEEVVLMEQFIQCVPEELAVWIKEKKPTSVRQAAELADTYTLARSGDEKTSTRKANGPKAAGQQPQPRTPETIGATRGRSSAWPKKRYKVLPLQRCGPYDDRGKESRRPLVQGAIWRIVWRSGVEHRESQVREHRRESRTDADRHRM